MEKNRVSNSTDMILNMQGGFITIDCEGVEIKVTHQFLN